MSSSLRLEVSIDEQRLDVYEQDVRIDSYPVSTAAKGVGFEPGSFRTPTGRFVICEKIGEGLPLGTCFRARQPVGILSCDGEEGQDRRKDLIVTRILRLTGLDPENANSYERMIYLHGTNHEDRLGQPASHGCVRLGNQQMLELFDRVEVGTELVIHPPTRRRGKLIFFDCDSTLSSIEGIDELARFRGPQVYAEVAALTHAAMDGKVPLDEVFARRIEMIRPDREACEAVSSLYLHRITPGAEEVMHALRKEGWTIVILSGGFAPLIRPLADMLGIDLVEAVPLALDEDGNYVGFGRDYPTTRNLGKNEVIREWKKSLLPERVVMVGDGVSDLETKPDVDCFIGYGGVVQRDLVKAGADVWIATQEDFCKISEMLSHPMFG